MYSQTTRLGHKWRDQPLNSLNDFNVDIQVVFTRFEFRLLALFLTDIFQNNASTGVAKQTIGGGHSQQYGTVSAQWLREHC